MKHRQLLFSAALLLTATAARAQFAQHLRGFGPPQQALSAGLGVAARPLAADVNGDGLDDIVLFNHVGSDVDVALNITPRGSPDVRFAAPVLWKLSFCSAGEVPLAGDWNNDGMDDIACVRGPDALGWRALDVAFSNGSAFGSTIGYGSQFARAGDLIRTGDVNGDGADDFLGFDRTTIARVYALVSNQFGTHGFTLYRAFGFCRSGEIPAVADMTGDGKADILSFNLSNGQVRRARSGWPAKEFFISAANEPDGLTPMNGGDLAMPLFAISSIPAAGDFTGDGLADILEFNIGFNSVNAAWSDGNVFTGFGFGGQEWHTEFAGENDAPLTGKFDWDRNADIAMLVRSGGPGTAFSGIRVAVAGGHARPTAPPVALGAGTQRKDRVGAAIPPRGTQRMLVVRTIYQSLPPTAVLPSAADLSRRIFGSGANPPADTLAGYFNYISHGHMTIVPAIGPGVVNGVITITVPATQPTNDWIYNMGLVQSQFAAGGGDFMSFDAVGDNDGVVEDHELNIMEINGGTGGQVQGLFSFSPAGFPAVKLAVRPQFIGGHTIAADGDIYTACHEFCHTLGALDHYFPDGSAMAVQTLLGGNTAPNISHADIWHRMRFGWVTPRSFDIAKTYCAAPIVALTTLGTPDAEAPLQLFSSAHTASSVGETYFFETRSGANRYESALAPTSPGVSGIFWHAQTSSIDGALRVEQLIHPGGDGVVNSLPQLNTTGIPPADVRDDMIQYYPPGTPAYISGGVNLQLNTPVHANDFLYSIQTLFPTNRPWAWPERGGYNPNGIGWKVWRPTDGTISLNFKNQTPLPRTFQLANAGSRMCIEWGTDFRPWLQSIDEPALRPSFCPQDRVTLRGAMGTGAWTARIPFPFGEFLLVPADSSPEHVSFNLPATIASGDHPVFLTTPGRSGAVSNALTVTVSNPFRDWLDVTVPSQADQTGLIIPSADYDSDGVPNIIEFVLNTRPDNPAQGPGALHLDLSVPGQTKLRWQQFTFNSGKWTLVPQVSTDLTIWTRLSASTSTPVIQPYQTWTSVFPSQPARLFVQLMAVRMP